MLAAVANIDALVSGQALACDSLRRAKALPGLHSGTAVPCLIIDCIVWCEFVLILSFVF